jgi:hypothetical protein
MGVVQHELSTLSLVLNGASDCTTDAWQPGEAAGTYKL